MTGIENPTGTIGLRYPGFNDAPSTAYVSGVTVRFYHDAGAVTDPDDIDDDGDGFTENRGDCNDQDATIYPGAPEICGDGIDQDCDRRDTACDQDEDDPYDVDNDGDGFAENRGDCNDQDATIYPGAPEICGDGIDQNCDGRDEACSEIDPPDVEPLLPTLYFPLFYSDFVGQTYIGLLNNSGTETLEGELIAFNSKGFSLNELSGTQPFKVILEPLGRLEVSLSEILQGVSSEVAYVKFVGTINSGLGYCRFAVDETGQAAAYPALYEPQDVKELQLPWLTFAEGWKTRVGFINISALWMKYKIEFNNGAVFEGR
ncbi:putative metal-binding motif-containing protein, partial [bacterium]|nr:putative metal-binding motif-containing protein [bacterium]